MDYAHFYPWLSAHQTPQEAFFVFFTDGYVAIYFLKDASIEAVKIFRFRHNHKACHLCGSGRNGEVLFSLGVKAAWFGVGASYCDYGAVFSLAAICKGIEAGLRVFREKVEAV